MIVTFVMITVMNMAAMCLAHYYRLLPRSILLHFHACNATARIETR